MKLGIVGLPNVGKSTLFNAITQAGAQAANYPFCTIEPNTGIVSVPDYRLDKLSEMYQPKKTTPATIEFVDIAGLVKGASNGEGLGNKFLSHIREVDAIVHVVRCFDDTNVIHVEGNVDPIRDIDIINLELILADMETVSKRKQKSEKLFKSGNKDAQIEFELSSKLYDHLSNNNPIRSFIPTKEESDILKSWFLLTEKPVIYVANISENDINTDISNITYVNTLTNRANLENSEVVVISSKIEEEISLLDKDEKDLYLQELGINQSGLDKLITKSYSLLGLISFLTAGKDECRAWTIKEGTKAPQAAGKIHSDFEKGFIRAEVVNFDTLIKNETLQNCKEKGLVKSEGKDYIMKDGDIVLFRFNV